MTSTKIWHFLHPPSLLVNFCQLLPTPSPQVDVNFLLYNIWLNLYVRFSSSFITFFHIKTKFYHILFNQVGSDNWSCVIHVLCVIEMYWKSQFITLRNPNEIKLTKLWRKLFITIVDVNFRRPLPPPCQLLSTFGDPLPPPLGLTSIKYVPLVCCIHNNTHVNK